MQKYNEHEVQLMIGLNTFRGQPFLHTYLHSLNYFNEPNQSHNHTLYVIIFHDGTCLDQCG